MPPDCSECERLRGIIKGLAQRVVDQSELLSRRAERKTMSDEKQAGDPRFYALLDRMAEMHRKKSNDYGLKNDFLANVRAAEDFGIPAWQGVALRMNDKMVRVKAFSQKGKLECESLVDSFLDLASYALIAVMLLEEAQGKESA